MDKLQLSDPSLLANHPQLQRRTLFESIKNNIKVSCLNVLQITLKYFL